MLAAYEPGRPPRVEHMLERWAIVWLLSYGPPGGEGGAPEVAGQELYSLLGAIVLKADAWTV